MTDEPIDTGPATFSLGALAPKPMRFQDDGEGGDGQLYDVRTPLMFNSLEQERLASLQRELPKQLASIAVLADGAQVAEAMHLLDTLTNDFVRLLIPTLPVERATMISTNGKIAFIKWWTSEVKQSQEGAQQATSPKAPRARTPRGRRSPASSTPTTSTRAKS